MADTRESEASGLVLEVYRQANEHSRETDRKRNILVGSYLTIVGIGAGWLVNAWLENPDSVVTQSLVWFILVTLLIVGLPVLRAVTVYRAWHAYYGNICKAVQWSLARNLNLYEAACALIRDRSNRYEYFSPRGVEFTMYVFVLVLWGILLGGLATAVLLLKHWFHLPLAAFTFAPALAITLGFGIWCYRHHLLAEQKRFPVDSWMIISPSTESTAQEEQPGHQDRQ